MAVNANNPQAVIVGAVLLVASIAARNQRGQASTEDLRKAVVHYRALFEDLLEAGVEPRGETRKPTEPNREAVQS
jgi:hypothetical protein